MWVGRREGKKVRWRASVVVMRWFECFMVIVEDISCS